MGRIFSVVLLIVMAGLWISSSLRHQSSVGTEQQTVQAQATVVAGPAKAP